uniref:Activator 1 subunit 5 n=1 Tax=Plectus sambesii TaxID=2011161 RepID=A0A914V2L8_9BILA
MVQLKDDRNLPWVEKYRPSTLDELISHKDIVTTINKFIDEQKLPHLLLYGPPGTGKTTTILAAARRMYDPKHFHSMVLELNASDDRGIGVVREQIINFAQTKTLFATKKQFKLIILDEADAMTRDAQNALRRVIEKFTENVRFCLIGNYLSKIIPAIQSRCTRFRFAPLIREQMLPRLRYVVEQEKVNITEDGEQALLTLSQGDMRRVLNVLQSAAMAYDVVNEVNVYSCVGHPLKQDIQNIVNWLLNDTFQSAFQRIERLKVENGLALQDILTEVHHYVHRLDVSTAVHVLLIDRMADIEYRLASGASEKMQLGALVAVFVKARALITADAEPMDQ